MPTRTQTSRRAAAAPAAPRPSLDDFLSTRLHELNKLGDAFGGDTFTARAGVSAGDGRCLAAIGAHEPLSVVELAQHARLNKAQASRAAQSLADQGLVRKQANEADARGVVLTLTAAGRAAWRKVMTQIERRNEQVFGALSPTERKTLSKLLDRLIESNRTEG